MEIKEKRLTKIVTDSVEAKDKSNIIQVRVYYENSILVNAVKNEKYRAQTTEHVVYQFTCRKTFVTMFVISATQLVSLLQDASNIKTREPSNNITLNRTNKT